MTAFSRSKITGIYIVAAGTSPSDLADSDKITGEIKNYSRSGGEKDVESDPHFGGFVDKEKAPSQYELSFEITPSFENATRWEALALREDPVNTGIYTSVGEIEDKMVVIESYNSGNNTHKSWAFNNCNVTMNDMDHPADDNQKFNMTLKFAPADKDNYPNYQVGAVAATSLISWSSLSTT